MTTQNFNVEEMILSKQFQEILALVPEELREGVLKSIREMAENFEENVLKPLTILSLKNPES